MINCSNFKRFLAATVLITTFMTPLSVNAQSPYMSITQFHLSTQPETRKDDIQWRYKIENGKLFRCLYNYSIGEWVGEWEVC